ncbi:MAG: ATP-binding protein [Bacteroidota bacterium]
MAVSLARHIVAALLVSCCTLLGAQAQTRDTLRAPIFDLPEAGKLPVTYFSPRDWPLGQSAWSITQDGQGLIYVATDQGLVLYDGVRWTSIDIGMMVRSVAAAPDGRIYLGAQGDLGYLAPDTQGRLVFHSLLDHVPDSSRTFTDVWATVAHDGIITFQTTTQLMHWDGDRIAVTEYGTPEHEVSTLAVIQDRLLGATRSGIVEVAPGQAASAWRRLTGPDNGGFAVLDGGPGHFITMTTEGVMERCAFDVPLRTACAPWASDMVAAFSGKRPYAGLTLQSGAVALGFDGDGVALLHPDGTLLRWLTEADGLDNTEVMYLFEDRDGVLWLGLYTGLARARVNTPITAFGKSEGIPSTVSDVVTHQGTVYASTMLGLRKMAREGERVRFVEVPSTDSGAYVNCTPFVERGARLLTACSDTIYELVDGQAKRIAKLRAPEDGAVFMLEASAVDSARVYVATEVSVQTHRLTADSLASVSVVEGIRQAFLFAEEPPPNDQHSWVYSKLDGLARIAVTDTSARIVWQITEQDGLPQLIADIRWQEDRLLVMSTQGVLETSLQGDGTYQLVPSMAFSALEVPRQTRWVHEDSAGRHWVFSDSSMTVWEYDTGGTASRLWPSHIPALQAQDPQGLYGGAPVWVGTDAALMRYAIHQDRQLAGTDTFPVSIRQARTLQGDSLLYGGHEPAGWTAPQLPHTLNGLRFTYAAPLTADVGTVQYRVRLDGGVGKWSAWTEETQKDYTNLAAGTYTFHVQARLADGRLSIVDTLAFQVLPPWYQTWWAYLIWSTLFAGVVVGIASGYNKQRTRRLEAERRVLERQVAARTEELEQRNIHLRELNETLELRTVELRDSLEQNKQILGITAHDLKNPLGGIHALAEMLADDFHDFPAEECIEQVELIRDEAKRTLTIIRDMLDRYRQDADTEGDARLTLHKQPTALEPLLRNVVRWNKRQATAKRMRIQVEAAAHPHILADTGALQRAVDNLLSNAIKYSPEGSLIRVTLGEATERGILIQVHDQGPGLTEDDKRKVFGKLQRLSATPTDGEHSTGLGLFIVKELVEAHGGTVGVESTLGKGATFWIQLPPAVILEQPRPEADWNAGTLA